MDGLLCELSLEYKCVGLREAKETFIIVAIGCLHLLVASDILSQISLMQNAMNKKLLLLGAAKETRCLVRAAAPRGIPLGSGPGNWHRDSRYLCKLGPYGPIRVVPRFLRPSH